MNFNEFVNKRRKELNMSIDELVTKSGIPKGTLSKITAGISTNPTLSTVEAICLALECSLNEAVGYVERNQITSQEKMYIKKYRTLDEYGKQAVNSILDVEYERCTYIEEPSLIEIPYSFLKASAGTGNWLDEDQLGTIKVVDTPEARKADIVIEVYGDSMLPVYSNGDKVLVRLQPSVYENEIGIFIVDGSGFIKKMGKGELVSMNPEFDNIPIKECTDIRCVGKVIGIAEEI